MTDRGFARTAVLRVLRSELKSDLAAANRLAQEALQTFTLKPTPRPVETIYATALLPHHFYSALESAFERMVKVLDEDVPSGADWHRQLLQRMTLEIDDIRPPLLPAATSELLDEYRRFRHIVRHAYESPLQENRLQHLADQLPLLLQGLNTAFDNFTTFLDELIAAL